MKAQYLVFAAMSTDGMALPAAASLPGWQAIVKASNTFAQLG